MRRVIVSAFWLLTLCFTGVTAQAERPVTPFKETHVAVRDTVLSSVYSPNIGVVVEGTVIHGVLHGDDFYVQTKDGKHGFANPRDFRSLGDVTTATLEALTVAKSSNAFAFDLYQQLSKSEEDVFFSPLSISMALSITYAGARSHTKEEMAKVLCFPANVEPHEGYSTLLRLLISKDAAPGNVMTIANHLWGSKEYRFDPEFTTAVRRQYLADLTPVDFTKTKLACGTINAWVAKETRNRIKQIVSPSLRPDAALVITNAIYFKGTWHEKFEEAATEEEYFYGRDKIIAQFMKQTAKFPYVEDSETQVLSLPYQGDQLAMIVALPKDVEGLSHFEAGISEQRFSKWLSNLTREKPIEVHFPKFKMEPTLALADTLQTMGMTSAFDNGADFSGITRTDHICIDEVTHKAFIEVDEEGTEAAAATAIILVPVSAHQPPQPVVFRANHPFWFAIIDIRSQAVLFMGRVNAPKVK